MYTKYTKFGIVTAWSILGVKRGMNAYDYTFNKEHKFYNNKDIYLYSIRMFYGVAGFGVYANPFLLFFTIPKEIYRLEVNLRELEEEKKTDYYNRLL